MRLHTTGSFAIYSRSSGKEITPRGRKSRALLAYLTSSPGTRVSKERLAALLWGDRADTQARASLRQALRELRLALNETHHVICSDREHIWICEDSFSDEPMDDAEAPRDAFEDLDNVTPEFDEWLAAERSRRSKRRIAELRKRAEELLRVGQGEESLVLVEQMQAISPHDEDALRLGLEAEFERGHPAAIAERYSAAAALLITDVGVGPSNESRGLRDRLIQRLTATHRHGALSDTDQEYCTSRAREERDIDENGTTVRLARYLRKSLVIKAVQWFKHGDHPAVLAGSLAGATGFVDTPEGRLTVDSGDWIITGIAGENYPCKPHIFEQLYERQE